MALIYVHGGLPVVHDLNAFEQIFNKLLRGSILHINRDYIKYIKCIYELEEDGFNISLKNILNASFNVYSEMLNPIPITTTLFGLTYSVPTNRHSLEYLDTVLLLKFDQFQSFLDYGGVFIDDKNFANALDFIAIKINNIIKEDDIIFMPLLSLPEDIKLPSYILNNFCNLLDCTITYLVDIKKYSLYDILKHTHVYSRLVFYNIASIFDKFIKLAKLNGELDNILSFIINDYSNQILGEYLSENIKINQLINFTSFLIPYLFFNIKSINLVLSYIQKQEHRVLLYKIPITFKLFFQCMQDSLIKGFTGEDGIVKGFVTKSEYIKDLTLFIKLGIYDDDHFLRRIILCYIRNPELKAVVVDALNIIIFPDKQFKSTNLLSIIIESVKNIENMHILEYVFKRFENSKEFLFELILENMAKIMIDHLNNTEFFIKIITKFIYYGFELSRFSYFLDQCFELSTTANIFYNIINNNTIMNSIRNIHFDTFKYSQKNINFKIAKKWNISNKIMINGVCTLLKNILNKIIPINTLKTLPPLTPLEAYTEDEIISLFESDNKKTETEKEKKKKKKTIGKNIKTAKITNSETAEITHPEITHPETAKITHPEITHPETAKIEIAKTAKIETVETAKIETVETAKIETAKTAKIETAETAKIETVEITDNKKHSEEKLLAIRAKKALKKLNKLNELNQLNILKELSALTDTIGIKTLLSKLVTESLLEINKTDVKFIIYTGGSVGLGTNIAPNCTNIAPSDLDLCLIIDYIEDNLNVLLNILLLKLSPYFKEGYKIIPSGKKSPTMITMVTNNSQSIAIDVSICVCNDETPFDFRSEIFMAHSIYQAYNTHSRPEYRFLFYDTNASSLSSLHASYALIFNCTIQNKISTNDVTLFQGIVIGIKTILIKNGAYGSTIGYLGGSALAVMAMVIILRYNKTINSIEESIRVNFGIKTFCKFYSNKRFWETFGLSIMDGIIDKPQDRQNISMYIDAYGSCLSYNVWKNTMDRTISIFEHIASIPDIANNSITNIAPSGYYYTFIGTFCSKNLSNTLKEIIITLQLGFTTECNIIPMSHPDGFVLVIEQDLNLDYVKAVVSGFNLHFNFAHKETLCTNTVS
jgi:hypothetical protein